MMRHTFFSYLCVFLFTFTIIAGQADESTIRPHGLDTFAVGEFFPLTAGNHYEYTGFCLPNSSTDDDFSWDILPTTRLLHGVNAAEILTSATEQTDDRHTDIDYWSLTPAGELRFHGFTNGEADGGGTFPAQDIILETPYTFGDANTQIGSVFSDIVDAPGISAAGFTGTASVRLTATYVEFLPLLVAPLGSFADVLRVTFTVEVVSVDIGLGPFPINPPFPAITSEFFLKRFVGMVAHDQNGDLNDAEIQALDSATVNGGDVTPDGTSTSNIAAYMLGITNNPFGLDPSTLDFNMDGTIDVSDNIDCQF